MHDVVDRLLYRTDSSDEPAPSLTTSAPRILSAYAQHSIADLLTSDIHIQALVASHHITQLVPDLTVPEDWRSLEQARRSLDKRHQETISKAIFASLAELLDHISSVVS